jgi:hypothetical protein
MKVVLLPADACHQQLMVAYGFLCFEASLRRGSTSTTRERGRLTFDSCPPATAAAADAQFTDEPITALVGGQSLTSPSLASFDTAQAFSIGCMHFRSGR